MYAVYMHQLLADPFDSISKRDITGQKGHMPGVMHYLFTMLLLEPIGLKLGLLSDPRGHVLMRVRVQNHNDRPMIRVSWVPIYSFVGGKMGPALQTSNRSVQPFVNIICNTVVVVEPSVRITNKAQVLKLTKLKR